MPSVFLVMGTVTVVRMVMSMQPPGMPIVAPVIKVNVVEPVPVQMSLKPVAAVPVPVLKTMFSSQPSGKVPCPGVAVMHLDESGSKIDRVCAGIRRGDEHHANAERQCNNRAFHKMARNCVHGRLLC
jgi:hypothetical protein